MAPFRSFAFAAPAALAVAAAAPLAAQPSTVSVAADRPVCAHALVALDESVDSARARPGDSFTFELVDAAAAPNGLPLPAGTRGYGVVANAAHAERGGRPGYLALETRFFVAPDGTHVAAIIDRADASTAGATGATANAPGFLGMIPFMGYALGPYGQLHHGRDATIPRGTRLTVLIGDDAALGACRLPRAHETFPPQTSPAPSSVPSTPISDRGQRPPRRGLDGGRD